MKSKIHYRRRRAGKTNYQKRLTLIMSGSVRIVVRKSIKNIIAHAVTYDAKGDTVIAAASSKELAKKYQWNVSTSNIPAAYLVGALLSKKLQNKGIKKAILDIGMNQSVKGSRIFAVLKGVVDAGLEVPHKADIFPSDDRISGKHIEKYAVTLQKENKEQYNKQFSSYIKNKNEPEKVSALFEKVKAQITGAKK